MTEPPRRITLKSVVESDRYPYAVYEYKGKPWSKKNVKKLGDTQGYIKVSPHGKKYMLIFDINGINVDGRLSLSFSDAFSRDDLSGIGAIKLKESVINIQKP